MDENTHLPEAETGTPVTVCDVRFRTGTKTYYFDPAGIPVKPGDHLIIETARGPEFGTCTAEAHVIPESAVVAPLRKVLRIATDKDEYVNEDNLRLEKSAYRYCQEQIARLGLEMQLVSCECVFDGSKILFYFTADGRVDFRELVRVLASNFHTRVELRQIGVRDKAKMVGGLGICGRPFCCGQFLGDFAPVSIKMAKTQNLSLNPTKISGTCGRLMCCLKYEQDAYEDLLKTSPKTDSFVDTPAGRGTVTDVNLMAQSVKVRLEKDPDEIVSFRNEEIAVYRSGKAKKTDEPVPEDWAPVSGGKPTPPPADEYPRFERVSVKRVNDDGEEPKPRRNRRDKKPAEPAPAEAPRVNPEPADKPKQPAATKPDAPAKKPAEKPKQPAAATHEAPAKKAEKQPVGAIHESPAKKPANASPEVPAKADPAEASAKKPRKRGGKKHKKQAPKLEKPLQELVNPAPEAQRKNAQTPKAEKPVKAEKPAGVAHEAPAKAAVSPKPENSAEAAAKKNKKRRYYHRPKKQG